MFWHVSVHPSIHPSVSLSTPSQPGPASGTPAGGSPTSGTPHWTWLGGPLPGGGTPPQVPPSSRTWPRGVPLPGGGTPLQETDGVLDTPRSVCLLHSRRRTFLFLHISTLSFFLRSTSKQLNWNFSVKLYLYSYFNLWGILISATWKIIQAFLSSEQKQKLLMLKKKDLKKYIPEAGTWWEHMKEKENKWESSQRLSLKKKLTKPHIWLQMASLSVSFCVYWPFPSLWLTDILKKSTNNGDKDVQVKTSCNRLTLGYVWQHSL